MSSAQQPVQHERRRFCPYYLFFGDVMTAGEAIGRLVPAKGRKTA
jgi:hypothetical protein